MNPTEAYKHIDKVPDYDIDDVSEKPLEQMTDEEKRLTLKQLHTIVDNAYNNSRICRQAAADDIVFYNLTQWDDSLISMSALAYRGVFDVIKKAGRRILATLRENPVQVQFDPRDDTNPDTGAFVEDLYRTDDRHNYSQEAYQVASQEQVVCGVGMWELYTDYENSRGYNKNQIIKRRPLHEANNNVFWDPDSKLMDKSDAQNCSILTPYSKEAYIELVEDLTGEDVSSALANFKYPQMSYTFPWSAGNFRWVYVGRIYTRRLVKDIILTFQDPITQDQQEYFESDLKDKMDDLIEQGLMIVQKKECERYRVTQWICSMDKILAKDEIACDHIPVVPVYGERAYVEGQETWQGLTRSSKDPQRLRNFVLSYVADIASRSPRPKPIFTPEQIQGFEDMYEQNGADNQLPYFLQNRKDLLGNDLPLGPVSMMADQPIPSSVATLVQLTREAVDDVAPGAKTGEFVDVDLSGDALAQLNARLDQDAVVYQENMKHAKRRDGEIWVSFAARIHDAPKQVKLTAPDGTVRTDWTIKQIVDDKTGDLVVLNDLRNATFDVYTDVGPSYKSQKDQFRREISQLIPNLPPDDPMRPLYMLVQATLMDGPESKIIREYAKKQLIVMGYKQPETDEEKMIAQAASQPQKPDANMVLAQAETLKGQAQMAKAQAEMIKAQAEAGHKFALTHIDDYKAQTERINTANDIHRTNGELRLKAIDTLGKHHERMSQHPIVMQNHPIHGDIDEHDIQTTMAKHGMNRDQVIHGITKQAVSANMMA